MSSVVFVKVVVRASVRAVKRIKQRDGIMKGAFWQHWRLLAAAAFEIGVTFWTRDDDDVYYARLKSRKHNGRRRRREEEDDDDDANGRPQNGPGDASSPPQEIIARFGCGNGSGSVSAIPSESSVQSPARRRVPVRAPGSETDVRTMGAVRDVQKRRREEMLVRAREFEREQGVYDCISHEHRVWAEVVRCVSSSSSSSSSY